MTNNTTLERRQRNKEQLAQLKRVVQELWRKQSQKGRYIKCLEEEMADLRKRAKKNKRFVEPLCEWCENGFCCSHGVFPDSALFEFQRQEEALASADYLLQQTCYPCGYFPDDAFFDNSQCQEEAVASADNLLQHLMAAPENEPAFQAPLGLEKMATKRKLSVSKNDREAVSSTSQFMMNNEDEEEDHAKRSSIAANYGDWTAFTTSDHLDHESDLERLQTARDAPPGVEPEDFRAEQEGKDFLLSIQNEWERAHWEAKASEQASEQVPVSVLMESAPEVRASNPYQNSTNQENLDQEQRDSDRVFNALDKEEARKRAACGCRDAAKLFHACAPMCVEIGCNGNCLSAWKKGERQEYFKAQEADRKEAAEEEARREIARKEAEEEGAVEPPSTGNFDAWRGTYDGEVLASKEREDLALKESEDRALLLAQEASRNVESTANQCGPCGGIGCIFCSVPITRMERLWSEYRPQG